MPSRLRDDAAIVRWTQPVAGTTWSALARRPTGSRRILRLFGHDAPTRGVQPRRRSQQPRRRDSGPRRTTSYAYPQTARRDVVGGRDEPAVHGRSRRGPQRGRPAARRRHGRHGPEAAGDGARGRPGPGLARRRHHVRHEAPCLARPRRRGPPPGPGLSARWPGDHVLDLALSATMASTTVYLPGRRVQDEAGTGVEVGRHIEAGAFTAGVVIHPGEVDVGRRVILTDDTRTDRARARAGPACDRARIGLSGRVRPSRDLAPDRRDAFARCDIRGPPRERGARQPWRDGQERGRRQRRRIAGVPALRAPQELR